jgi:hypothetical protein
MWQVSTAEPWGISRGFASAPSKPSQQQVSQKVIELENYHFAGVLAETVRRLSFRTNDRLV